MLKSIVEDNSTTLVREANKLGISQDKIVQIINTGTQLALFYHD